MSVNRILKKRKQQAQNSNEADTGDRTGGPQFMPEQNKMSIQEAKLQEEFEKFAEYSQYNPSGYTFTNTHLPYSSSLNNRCRLPISVMLPPVSYEMDPVEKSIDNIPRCASCRAYMNYYNEVKKNSFVCFLCGRENSFMGNYEIDPDSVETTQPSYHVLGGQNVYLQSPPQNAFIFLVDITASAAQSKILYYFVAAVKQVLARQQFDETQIFFFTYDDVLHEYDFSGQEVKCTIFDPTITQPGSRLQQNFLSNIRDKLFDLLDSLEQMAQHNKKQSSNFYQSFCSVFEAIKHTGGKVFILQANQAIVGQQFANQYLKNPNNQVDARPRSFLETRNKKLFNTFIQNSLQAGISFSFFIFQKNYKNVRVFGDFSKLTNSQILVYKKDVPEDLTKFYYEISYLLSCTYYKDVRMQLMVSPGWVFTAVYGNLYRIKEYIAFKFCHLDPSRRAFILVMPQQSLQLPYFCMQVVTNYLYNRQHFVCVNTIVLPLTTSLQKLYLNQDYPLSAASLSRAALSSLRLQQINILRNKFMRNLSGIWKCANQFYKKKVSPQIVNLILSQLGMLKSQHFQLDSINDTHALDTVVSQRCILQSSGPVDIQNFFCPYLFNLSSMTQEMCRDEDNFVYPQICELKFSSVKQGMFLLDNGLSLYLYISKVCDPALLRMLYGKQKISKNDQLSQQNFLTNNLFGQQVTNLIRVLREQKCFGWVPLYVVRCGQGSLNQKTFYMNFYAEKYDQFRGCKYSLPEFTNILADQF